MRKLYTFIFLLILFSFNAQSQVALDSMLTACYPFSGNANDMSGNNHNGTVYGATLTADRFGNPNSAYYFNGVNNYIEVARFDSLVPTDEVSVSFWCKVFVLASHAQFQIQPDDAADRFNVSVHYDHNGVPSTFWDYGSIFGTGRFDTINIPFVTQWEHYVFISSASQNFMKEYRNGVLLKAIAQHDVITNRIKPLWIGMGSTLNCMNGDMDDIRFYNRVLNDAEIMTLYTMTDNCSLAPVAASFAASDTAICQNDCISYTNLSVNANSYQWFFDGATPPSSTDENPQNICYLTGGHYDATLIASNGEGSDTLTLSTYITVHPAPPVPAITQSYDSLICSTDPSYAFYQWYIDTALIVGATNPYYVGPCGEYNVSVTDTNGCRIAVGINAECLGVRNFFDEKNIIISPNPAGHQLTIYSSSFQNEVVMVSVMNVMGQASPPAPLQRRGESAVIDVSRLAAGIYFLQIKTERGSVVKKFVKE